MASIFLLLSLTQITDFQVFVEVHAAVIRASDLPDTVKGWHLVRLTGNGMTTEQVRAIFGRDVRPGRLFSGDFNTRNEFWYHRYFALLRFDRDGKVCEKKWEPPSMGGLPTR